MSRCIGRHWNDDFDWDDEPVEPVAEYFRECVWCGIPINLCIRCRDRVFLCERCFRNKSVMGKDAARAAGEARERRRIRDRRRRLVRRAA